MTVKSAATFCPKCYGVAMVVDVDGDISLLCRTPSCRGSASLPPKKPPLPRQAGRKS